MTTTRKPVSGDLGALKVLMLALYEAIGVSRETTEQLNEALPSATTQKDRMVETISAVVIDGRRPFRIRCAEERDQLHYDLEGFQTGTMGMAAAMTITVFELAGKPIAVSEVPFQTRITGRPGLEDNELVEIYRLAGCIRIAEPEHNKTATC